ASTATTVAAFAPMLFWPGIIGEFMSYLPLTLIITLTSSLFVALVINPVITGIFVKLESEERAPMNRRVKVISVVVMVVLALLIGLANWKTLVVLAVAIPVLYFLHTRVFKPIGDNFVQEGLPRFVARYRTFLTWMLQRDYGVKRAYLRHMFALTSFTGGLILVILGMMLSGVGPAVAGGMSGSGLLLLVPGMIALIAGLIGIMVHSLETIFLGGWKSVRAGLIFAGIMLTLLTLIFIGPREVEVVTIVNLMILPIVIVLVGVVGGLLNRKRRPHLVLTDGRAKLLTGAIGSFVAIIMMFQVAPTGVTFCPDTDPQQVWVTLEAALGTNLETSNQIADVAHERILDLLDDYPESQANLKNLSVNVGVSGDAQFGGGARSPERSRISLNMVDYADREEPSSVTMTKIRNQLQGIPGVDITIDKSEMGPPTAAPVNIEISGEN